MALAGRLTFVTGAGQGIGRAACQVFAREGAAVIAADRNKKNAEETVNLLSKHSNKNHLALDIDVAQSSSVKKSLESVLKNYSRPPSVIVNSAGIIRDNFILKLSEEDFQEVLDVNLKGTFLVTQVFANAIINNGLTSGSIINLSSIVGKYGNLGQANYCASKAGVELLTKTAAKELGRNGIRVNAILPGMINTPMFQSVPDKVKAKFISMIPLGRLGNPEELGEVICFLASDKSSFITGASIDVTGGF